MCEEASTFWELWVFKPSVHFLGLMQEVFGSTVFRIVQHIGLDVTVGLDMFFRQQEAPARAEIVLESSLVGAVCPSVASFRASSPEFLREWNR